MLAFLTAVALHWLAAPAAHPAPGQADRLQCRIEVAAGAKSKRCRVKLPEGRRVRRCADADRRAGHCDERVGGGRYVAWTEGTGGGRCRITKKKTKWDRAVSAKLSRVEAESATCTLHVELE